MHLKREKPFTALDLRLMAMVFMLCDHLWATLYPYQQWLTDIGRLAFPIFAFLLVEGFVHTGSRSAYGKRLFLFALISEIPFNLLTAGGFVNPFHQNVLFTFCLGFLLLQILDRAKKKHWAVYLAAIAGCSVLGYGVGMITFVDYYGQGILTILAFYVFRDLRFGAAGLFLTLLYLNTALSGGRVYQWQLLGQQVEIYQQSLALLALIPIFLYNGKPGRKSRWIQYSCYAFYPVHMLVLALLWLAAA